MMVLLRTETSPMPSALGIDDANFHAGKRLADGVGAEGLEIVDGDGCARFRQAVTVGDGYTEVVKKLQSLRLGECAADDDGAKFSAERVVHLLEQAAAEPRARTAFRQRFIDCD